MTPPERRRVSIQIDTEVLDQVDRIADEFVLSRSKAIELLLANRLNELTGTDEPPPFELVLVDPDSPAPEPAREPFADPTGEVTPWWWGDTRFTAAVLLLVVEIVVLVVLTR